MCVHSREYMTHRYSLMTDVYMYSTLLFYRPDQLSPSSLVHPQKWTYPRWKVISILPLPHGGHWYTPGQAWLYLMYTGKGYWVFPVFFLTCGFSFRLLRIKMELVGKKIQNRPKVEFIVNKQVQVSLTESLKVAENEITWQRYWKEGVGERRTERDVNTRPLGHSFLSFFACFIVRAVLLLFEILTSLLFLCVTFLCGQSSPLLHVLLSISSRKELGEWFDSSAFGCFFFSFVRWGSIILTIEEADIISTFFPPPR